MDYVHVLNRGVDKRTIVQDDDDRRRFVTDLIVMNDGRPVLNLDYHFGKSIDVGRQYGERQRLVTIHAWCLMDNHYHLLLSEHSKNGIAEFLKKLNMGYAKYFNLRHDRSGALFQGRTKRVHIKTDRQFLYIVPYIHLNPLDLKKEFKSWRMQCISNTRAAQTWVEAYRWSSCKNYSDDAEFAEILEGSGLYTDRVEYRKELSHFLKSVQDGIAQDLNLE